VVAVRIGEFAWQAGVTARALRHYESLGLLAAPRSANGYRDYGSDDLRLIAEIRSLLGLGFTLEETRPFLDCLKAGNPTGASCPDSLAVYRRKLSEVDGFLTRLHDVRDRLAEQIRVASAQRGAVAAPHCEFSTLSADDSPSRLSSPQR
jgi:DNA-binding transcriptional MerR regulator